MWDAAQAIMAKGLDPSQAHPEWGYVPGQPDAIYQQAVGTTMPWDQYAAQQAAAGFNPNLTYETSGMNLQQFANSPYSGYQAGPGGVTFTGYGEGSGWQSPTWIEDPNDAGSSGWKGFLTKGVLPVAGMALGAGALSGLLGSGAGAATAGTGAMDMGVGLDAMRNSFLGLDAGLGSFGASANAVYDAAGNLVSDWSALPYEETIDGTNWLSQDGSGFTDFTQNNFGNPLGQPYNVNTASLDQMINGVAGGGQGIYGNPLGFAIPGAAEGSGLLGMMSPTTLAGILGGGATLGGGLDLGTIFKGALPSIMNGVTGAALGAAGGAAPSLLDRIINGAGSLLGGGANSLLGGLGGVGDLAARLAPGAAALAYAKNTDPFDLSRMESLYNQSGQASNPFDYSKLNSLYDQLGSDPNLNPNLMSYDLQSGAGRDKLNSSLARRGVLGSSFGTYDQNSYDTLRGLGRSALLGQGLQQQAGIANNLLTAQMNERRLQGTDLDRQAGLAKDLLNAQVQERALKDARYGRAFDVFGRALSPGPTLYTAGR